MKLPVALLLLTFFGTAPFQCASDPEPDHRIEDTPAEALWSLSERFRGDGNDAARRTTLEQLVDRYPNSREAERARLVLSGREVAPDEVAPEEPTTAGGESRASSGGEGRETAEAGAETASES
jgi:hypothetical protein